MRPPGVPVAPERIVKRNEVYVIRMRTPKPGNVRGNYRNSSGKADVNDERRDEQVSFGNRCQASDVRRIQLVCASRLTKLV